MRSIPPFALAAGLAFAGPLLASDLTVDGVAGATVAIGSSTTLVLSGGSNLPALVGYDFDPGPSIVLGETFPLALSPANGLLTKGMTDPSGVFTQTLNVPNNPALVGVTLYLAGIVVDATDPNQLDLSGGASLSFLSTSVVPTQAQLAGKVRAGAPFFDWVGVVPQGEDLDIAVDVGSFPGLIGQTVDLYVTQDRSALDWSNDPVLNDLSSDGFETVNISLGDLTANTFTLDPGVLSGDGGDVLGVGYDIVIDVNQNGLLDAADWIDGLDSGAGIYITRDPTLPGPYSVVEILYSGGSFLGQNLFFPSDIALLSDVPIVIISHGNGHNYQWYDHLGNHLASYGYVVMSHENNTMPGVMTASTTTLTNTDFFLGNLATIAGGALLGKVDVHNITWLGHSRGGEGVAIAYDRIFDGTYVPANFVGDDIVLISSIAPVDFLGTNVSNPHAKNYHLWVGGSDSDVSGCASQDLLQSFHLLGRAENQRQSISLYGAGHGDFHNGTGSAFATGPCLVGKSIVHAIMRGHLLPLVEYHMRGNQAGLDYLWRHYEDLHPQAAPIGNPCLVANLQYQEGFETKFVIDNFQSGASTLVASSGATLTHDLLTLDEGRLDDNNTTFTNQASDVFNGMTNSSSTDPERGVVLSYDGTTGSFLSYDILPGDQDWTGFERLHFRACQATRHPLTISELADVSFNVRLIDGDGDQAVMSIGDMLAGIEEPYQRTSCGTGVGWGNEFESVRLGLQGFVALQPALDLDDIDKLQFEFGMAAGANVEARLGLDEIELHVR